MNEKILIDGIKEYGFNINEKQKDKFSLYSSLLKEWNEKINLTAITDDDGISIKHFLDCISILKFLKNDENINIIDIGTGGGFPGIPVKIMREDIEVTLLDSLNKRIVFLNEVIKSIGLEKIEAIHARAEEYGKNNKFREKYDYVVSRAVAPLKILSEYALPFVKTGGSFIALKAFDIEDELEEAKSMIGNLGGKIKSVEETDIPFSDITRKIIIIEKIKNTPKEFPRSNKKIKGNK